MEHMEDKITKKIGAVDFRGFELLVQVCLRQGFLVEASNSVSFRKVVNVLWKDFYCHCIRPKKYFEHLKLSTTRQ